MKKVYSHPKTVNSNLFIAVNNQMKRVIVANCKSMSSKCILSTYKGNSSTYNGNSSTNSGITMDAQLNSWPILNGRQCLGPLGQLRGQNGTGCIGCVTWYTGISRGSNLAGFCDYAGAQARAYCLETGSGAIATIDGSPGKELTFYNNSDILNPKSCPNYSCQYFSCHFGVAGNGYTGGMLQFTAQC